MIGLATLPSIMSIFDRWFPQVWLAAAGLIALAFVPASLLWAALDTRSVSGELVALKPMRFALSIGVYLLTICWMLGYARPERLSAPFVRGAAWALLVGAGIEFSCILVQAARGRRSHFNLATPTDAAISATMLVMAVLVIGMALPLAWEIARRPRPDAAPLMVWAIVAGLLATFVLGALTGAGMGRISGGMAIPETVRLPLLGSVRGGSLRIAHFLGIHAMQAFPLIAAVASMLRGRIAAVMLVVCAVCCAGATLALLSRSTVRENGPASADGAMRIGG